jgi:MULE transposase domain
MGVVLVAMATLLWSPHPDCPEHVKPELEARVRSFPPSFLQAPIAGEVFDNPDVCQERLQGWALSQGFAIVRKSGSLQSAKPRFEFRCIHHSNKTANTRQLEDHVERDENDIITSRRKQENTTINARSCPYLVVLSRKQLGRRGSGLFGLVLGVSDDTHSHSMAVNPLRYKKEHVKVLPSFLPALELGKSLRSANITYSVALRVLEQVGFPLDRSTYYNIRDRTASAGRDEFAGLVVALEEAGFIFECRMEEEFDSRTNVITDRQLQQLWFAHPKQVRYSQRFIADWALFVDGTFRTNALNLVLIVTAGITNCGSTFVSSLSFARSEAKLSFDFIFDSLKKHVFYDPYPVPRVVVSDQAAGLKASMPIALPDSIL